MASTWWYKKVGDDTEIEWPSGVDLPETADWTRCEFLNQFIERANRRRWASYAAYMSGIPVELSLVEQGTYVSSASWMNQFIENCMAYAYYQSTDFPETTDEINNTPGYGGSYTPVEDGDYVPVLQLTELRAFLDEHSVFGHWGFETTGTVVETWWKWEYDRDATPSYFWAIGIDPGYFNDLLGINFGAGFSDVGYFGTQYSDGWRHAKEQESATSYFRATGKDIGVSWKFYYFGKMEDGDEPLNGWKFLDGSWMFPGLNKLVELNSGGGNIENQIEVVGEPKFSVELFADYDPTWRNPSGNSSREGKVGCAYAKFLKVDDA